MTPANIIYEAIQLLQDASSQSVLINKRNFVLINDIVAMQEHYRLNKNFEISDQLRGILKNIDVSIIQGTGGYKYEDIPNALRGKQSTDTWKFDK